MSNWNEEVECIESRTSSFTEGKIYEVTNGYLKDNNDYVRGRFSDIYELNEVLASQFEEVVTVQNISKPKLCGILGVDVNEKFKIDFNIRISDYEYFINDRGNLIQIGQNFNVNANNLIALIINEEYTIIKLPFYQFNEDEIIILKGLWLNGYKYIARDKNRTLWAYSNIPKQRGDHYKYSCGLGIKINDDFFQEVQFGNILDISYELSKIN